MKLFKNNEQKKNLFISNQFERISNFFKQMSDFFLKLR